MPTVRVGVIGGGAAGIVAAKCLKEEGHAVVVFEKNSSIGGVWKYDEDPHADSCTYKSLRTNLPTVVMQLEGFPFPESVPCYPSHVDIHNYLTSYATHFHVNEVVRLNSHVTRVLKDAAKSEWKVSVASAERGKYEEVFDRLVVCNGHFSKPFYSTVKGMENFRGELQHSKTYRQPEAYAGKSVLVIGRGPSGEEISRELVASGATRVIVSSQKHASRRDGDSNSHSDGQPSVDHVEADGTVVLLDGTRLAPGAENVPHQPKDAEGDPRQMKPEVAFVNTDGKVFFVDGSCIEPPDSIIFCTGYVYWFGDLLPKELLFPSAAYDHEHFDLEEGFRVELVAAAAAGHIVTPLYKQVFAINDPTLTFIGLPFDTTTFQCFELQSVWISRVFSGFAMIPPQKAMLRDFCAEVRQMKAPLSKSVHCLGLKHFQYFTEVSELSKRSVDLTSFVLFGDAAYLLVNFPDFRSATYKQDPVSGKWTRRFTPSGSETELGM